MKNQFARRGAARAVIGWTAVFISISSVPALLALALPQEARERAASQPASAPVNPNIGHTRHHHHANAPHPKTSDASRFTTNRTGLALPLPTEQDAFTFVVFGDRTGGPATGVSVLADAVRDTNLLEPDFVITVGDLVEGYNAEEAWLTQMREYRSIMDHLLCPWFPVAGNHDVYWRGPSDKRPAGENEKLYEMHFGPLWYAFEHKNSWFVVLFSDEGNPTTGEKNFNKPDCQKMSPEQFEWLGATLKKAKGADHVFLFLHHPRWLKANYGDDWDRVHELLKSAGNVTAVFAGHIHKMRYDGPRDGIEYVTLATVGGGQSGVAPEAGYLHQFHVVTVRKQQVALAALPVGEVMDVREITGRLMEECGALAKLPVKIAPQLQFAGDRSVDAEIATTISNPASRPIEVTLTLDSDDSRWRYGPDHVHAVLEPGAARDFRFKVDRGAGAVDDSLRPLDLIVDIDYLAEGHRYAIPTRRIEVPAGLKSLRPAAPAEEAWLRLNGRDECLQVESGDISLPSGPMTLECWMNARAFSGRTGLVTKTESSDYGIFVSDGTPAFSIHVGGSYAEVKGEPRSLSAGAWHHIAGVYDGAQVRLYVDGRLVKSLDRKGERKTNKLPLTIGADVTREGGATSFFDGAIDAVRLSDVARYSGERFTPARRLPTDDDAVLLLNMDGLVGPWLLDESAAAVVVRRVGRPRIESAAP
ncbi:MAG: hypothetical protein AMXMBFR47_25040 [Planctomycetota bacterium]